MRHLIHPTDLRQLYLGHTRITDEGLSSLAALPALRILNLDSTSVTVDGVAKLKLALPDCRIESDFTDEQIQAAMAKPM